MKTFLIIDYYLHLVLGILLLCTLPFVFIPMILLAVLGGWQLFSGLITSLFFKKLNRNFYLIKAVGYVGFLFFITVLADENLIPNLPDEVYGILWLIIWLLFPVSIAYWYFKMVKSDYKKYLGKTNVKSNGLEMNSPIEKIMY